MSLTELHLLDGQTAEVKDIDRVRAWPARIFLLLLLAGAVFFALEVFRLPVPHGAIAPPDEFSALRALRHVEAIREAAPGGVEAYLAAQLAALGLAPESPVPGSRSVAGRLQGTQPTGAILLLTAYDPAGSASGAAGAAMMLETLRTFVTGPKPKNDVIVLFSATHPLDEALITARGAALVVRFERLSDRGPVALLGTSRENGWLLREALRDLPHPAVFLEANDVVGQRATDGAASLSFTAIGGPTAAGAAPDARTLQGGGESALAVLRRFGSLALPGPRTPDLVTFNVGPDQVVSYPATWSRAGGFLAAAAAALLLALGVSHRRLEIESFTTGVVFFPLVIALAAAVAAASLALLVRWNPGGHALPWGTPHSAWFSGGVLALAVAVAAALDVVLRARHETARADLGLAAAGLLWWAILAVVTGFRYPDLAVLAVVPSLLLVPAFLVLFLSGDFSRHPWLQVLALALAAVPAALLLTPVWRLLDVAAGWVAPAPRLSVAAVSAGLGALTAATLLPHLSLPRRRWLFPASCLVAAVGLLVAGVCVTP